MRREGPSSSFVGGEHQQELDRVPVGRDGLGLACSCRTSRSVKNPCSRDVTVGAVMTPAPWWRSCLPVKAIRGVGEQFGHCVQVPVRRGGIDMTEPGRQQRQAHLDVVAVAVPVEHRGHGIGVPQVMQPGWPRPGWVVIPAAATICLKVTPSVSGLIAPRRLLTNTVGQARAAVPTRVLTGL